jgi:AraC family carnitine catabolism transcriptional activator
MWWSPNYSLKDLFIPDYLVIFGGNLPIQKISKNMLSSLRYFHKNGSKLIAVDTGAFSLAEAGVISKNTKICLHWEAKKNFQERYPYKEVTDEKYVLNDNGLYFSAGGVSILDLFLKIISDLKGKNFAKGVSEALIYEPYENFSEPPHNRRYTSNNLTCNKVIKIMEENIENPLKMKDIAQEVNISLRSIERYFLNYFGISPIKYYLSLRIQNARNLLFYDEYKISEVANMCGFNYNSMFINTFKKFYNKTPSEFRKYFRKRQYDNSFNF